MKALRFVLLLMGVGNSSESVRLESPKGTLAGASTQLENPTSKMKLTYAQVGQDYLSE